MNSSGFVPGIYAYDLPRDIGHVDIVFIELKIEQIIFSIFIMLSENKMPTSYRESFIR